MTVEPEQTSLDLRTPTPQVFSNFIKNSSNEQTVEWLQDPCLWPMPILALIGEGGSGKSHLAHAFAVQHNGHVLRPNRRIDIGKLRGRFIAIDDADEMAEESLFILLNMALNGDLSNLLLTAKCTPLDWSASLPDLRSRLKNLPLMKLSAPDEILLEPIIRKLFDDYGREIDKSVVDYMLIYCSRHIQELEHDVALIERAARAQNADVTKRFVAKTLKTKI